MEGEFRASEGREPKLLSSDERVPNFMDGEMADDVSRSLNHKHVGN
jgi:hypothetical protein